MGTLQDGLMENKRFNKWTVFSKTGESQGHAHSNQHLMRASYYWPSCRCLVSRWMHGNEIMPCQISPVLWRPPALRCLQTDVNVRAEAQTAWSRQDVPAASLFHRSDRSSIIGGEMLTPYDVTGKSVHANRRYTQHRTHTLHNDLIQVSITSSF